jgi:uncharacterized damage-inducible protein DinB
MNLNQALINELQLEAASTRKMLAQVPDAHFDWKPHEKSMTLKRLASHVAELAGWGEVVVNQDELDFGTANFPRPVIESTEDLLKMHEASVVRSVNALQLATDEVLMKPWTLRNNGVTLFQLPKVAVLRGMCYNHTYHHRGQLSVFLRMLDVPVPGMYGPSADDIR